MTVIAEPVEADLDAGTAETDPPGFLCKWTDACGNGLEPPALGGTFAVSFLLSGASGAGATSDTDGTLDGAGGIVADGIARPGGLGASGGTPANEAGLAVPGGGGTPATEGGFGIEMAPGIPEAEGGADGAAAIGGEVGAGGTTPGIEGGFGATGGVAVWPAIGETPGGLGSGGIGGGATEGGCVEIDPGGFWTGLGGRFIIAVSRELDDSG